MGKEKFDFEVITEGSFEDSGYNIKTIIIRLNQTALNEYILSANLNCCDCYETKEEWENYKAQKESERKAWERKVLSLLRFTADTGYSITKCVSEIFTVVLFEQAGGQPCPQQELQQKDYEELAEQLRQEESCCDDCGNKGKGTDYCEGCGTYGNMQYIERLMADIAGLL